jgi:nucleotide-binding universal stress UspA family protein
MIGLNRILVATDFSTCSHEALEYASELARRFAAELHLLHVADDPHNVFPHAGGTIPVEELARAEAETDAALRRSAEVLEREGRQVQRSVVRGVPFVEIIRYAREHDIDLIVVGTHGRTGLQQALMGSVAERVVRKAPCPVLVVRASGHQFVMP